MKAISLWQPWASAIAVGVKRYETRSWPAVSGGTLYSGWLAIHASKRTKKPKDEGGEPLVKTLEDLLQRDLGAAASFAVAYWKGDAFNGHVGDLPLGAVVAVGWLKACHYTIDPRLAADAHERVWGNYGAGRFAWEFSEVWRLNTPLPVRGEQKLFNVDMPANWQDQSTKVF